MNGRAAAAIFLLVAGATALFFLLRSSAVEPVVPAANATPPELSSRPVTTPRLPGMPASAQAAHREDHHEPDDPAALADEGEGEPDDEEVGDEPAPDEAAAPDDAEPNAAAPSKPAARDDRPVGTLDKEAIQAAIKAVVPRVKACFERGLKQQPDLAGRVVVEFEIEADDGGEGVVTRGEVPDSETFSPFFDACVLKEVAGARFPAPSGGGKVTVRYPFQFDPGGGYGGAPPEGE
jgi:hypothetical protein